MWLAKSWMFLHLVAVFVPFAVGSTIVVPLNAIEPDWPQYFEGQELIRLPLTEREELFLKDFPGKLARFSDGERELVFRYLERETRKLHPAADCLKGAGYVVKPKPHRVDPEGNYWGCVDAVRGGQVLKVCEIIYDEQGRSWSDVSSWFWAATLNKSQGPWWAVTVASG